MLIKVLGLTGHVKIEVVVITRPTIMITDMVTMVIKTNLGISSNSRKTKIWTAIEVATYQDNNQSTI